MEKAKTDCKTITDKCINSVDAVFDGQNGDLARRGGRLIGGKLPWRVGKVFSMIVSYLTAYWAYKSGAEQPPPLALHLPSHVIAQASSASKAEKLIFKTAADDSKPVTATVSATDSTETGDPMIILGADEGDHHKGDIDVDLPSDGVFDALKKLEDQGQCLPPKSSRLFRRVDEVADCVTDNFQSILNAMTGDGPLHELRNTALAVRQDFPLPMFVNQQFNEAFGQALMIGAERLPVVLVGIAREQIWAASAFAFVLAVTIQMRTKLLTSRHVYLGKENLDQGKEFKVTCPHTQDGFSLKCPSPICEGKDQKCTYDIMKGCPCEEENQKCPKDAKDFVSSGKPPREIVCIADSALASVQQMWWHKGQQVFDWGAKRLLMH